MSKEQGGQRCITHARQAVESAAQGLARAEERLLDARAGGNARQLSAATSIQQKAVQRHTRAMVGLATTPQGAREMSEQVEAAEQAGDTDQAAALRALLVRGTAHAGRSKEKYRQWKAEHQDAAGDEPRCPSCGQYASDTHECPQVIQETDETRRQQALERLATTDASWRASEAAIDRGGWESVSPSFAEEHFENQRLRSMAIADAVREGVSEEVIAERVGMSAEKVRAIADMETPATPEVVSFAGMDREQRIEAIRSEIDAAIENLGTAEGWKSYLAATRKFHNYSFSNRLLIGMQRPNATLVAGAGAWRDQHHRWPAKGSKAIWIQAPVTRRKVTVDADTGSEETDSLVVGFRPVPVFDVSQTDGEPMPPRPNADRDWGNLDRTDAPPTMERELSAAAATYGYTVRTGDMPGSAEGYTDPLKMEIVLSEKHSSRRRALTLAHELGHVAAGHLERSTEYHTGTGGKRPEMEVEAESVGYVLARHYGFEENEGQKNSFAYVDTWAHGNPDAVRATAEKVGKTVGQILDQISELQHGDAEAATGA